MSQVYVHDCSNCRFLGHAHDHDVFLCLNEDRPHESSVVMRYSSEPSDYQSLRYSEFERIGTMPFVYGIAEAMASRWLTDNTEPTIGDAIFAKLQEAEASRALMLERFFETPSRRGHKRLNQQFKLLSNRLEVAAYR